MFCAYSDESGCFKERYQSICIVSGEKVELSQLRSQLATILTKYSVTEVKFSEVRTHSSKLNSARDFIIQSVQFAASKKIRIDILAWDTQDSRHAVEGIDNIANIERLYYKILRHISEHWNQTTWELYPDDGTAIKWEEIRRYINNTLTPRRNPNIMCLFEQEKCFIEFSNISIVKSDQEPLIQLADLFAGIACFSRLDGTTCLSWIEKQETKKGEYLFQCDDDMTVEDPNKTKCNRFQLMNLLNCLCKKHKMGVSFKTNAYFNTPQPRNPINFWNYKPQHPNDKAPVRRAPSK